MQLIKKTTSFSKLGHPVAKCASVRSVIWLHSSKSILSKYLQLCMKKIVVNSFQKIKLLLRNNLAECLKPNIGELMTTGTFECTQMRVKISQSNQSRVCKVTTFANAKLAYVWTSHWNISNRCIGYGLWNL